MQELLLKYFIHCAIICGYRQKESDIMRQMRVTLAILLIFITAGCAEALNLMDLHNSPLRSLLALQKAAQAHDTVEFEKYVCLDSFISKVYDDGIAAVSESGNSKLVSFSAATGIHKFVKPWVIPYAKRCVLERIAQKDNTDTKPESKAEEPKNKADELLAKVNAGSRELIERINPANILKETIDFDHSEIKKVATHKKTKEGAIVAATIYNTELKQNFVLRLALEPLGKKGWRVIEPINFREYALAVDRAKKAAKQP